MVNPPICVRSSLSLWPSRPLGLLSGMELNASETFRTVIIALSQEFHFGHHAWASIHPSASFGAVESKFLFHTWKLSYTSKMVVLPFPRTETRNLLAFRLVGQTPLPPCLVLRQLPATNQSLPRRQR